MAISTQQVFRIVFSSKRIKPAYLTQHKGNNHTFLINYPLNIKDENKMAYKVWSEIDPCMESVHKKEGVSENTEAEKLTVIRCAENMIIGSYILTKEKNNFTIRELHQAVIDDARKYFEKRNYFDTDQIPYITTQSEDVVKFLYDCADFGKRLATAHHRI
ncbi:MAG: hypothetical protein COU72_01965 [Parcubacteria group bacterium CG10_big_fil_rev_8_21_14_0_10_41_35]|nr:MAG: hypothetical protein COU72_01965 [Parcubacteria group bacterium CG10_big_fil_rev_8_21_14_0_10_41_35]